MLSPPFGGLVAFVKEAEALIERGQAERLRGEEGVGIALGLWAVGVRDSGNVWVTGVTGRWG